METLGSLDFILDGGLQGDKEPIPDLGSEHCGSKTRDPVQEILLTANESKFPEAGSNSGRQRSQNFKSPGDLSCVAVLQGASGWMSEEEKQRTGEFC